MSIEKIYRSNISCTSSYIDSEEKAIMAKLLAYGITPTGNKSIDRAKLHEIELKEAKQNNYVTGSFLTVSSAEEEKLVENKIYNRFNNQIPEFEQYQDESIGAQALGEQIILTLKLQNKFKKLLAIFFMSCFYINKQENTGFTSTIKRRENDGNYD